MSPGQIEDLAFRGETMPEGLDAAEQILFLALRYLYRYARLVQMPAEQGKREKMEILREHEQLAFRVRHMAYHARLWKEIEAAGGRYWEDRTLENADAFVEAVYGVRMKKREESV